MINIAVVAGTTRIKRESIKAAKFVAEVGKEFADVAITFVDPVDFTFPGDGKDPEGKDARYSKITAEADAFFIVTPEYNHSFPGSLKRMLDSELENYTHKPVAFGGASSGPWGGVRAIEALVITTRQMGMVATFNDVQFPFIQEIFDENGNPKDTKYYDYVRKVYTELIWMAKVLKEGREKYPSHR